MSYIYIMNFLSIYIFYVYESFVCMHAYLICARYVYVGGHAHHSMDNFVELALSSTFMWVLGLELRSSGLWE